MDKSSQSEKGQKSEARMCCTNPPAESFPGGIVVKNLPANIGDERDSDSLAGPGRSPGVGYSNPPQYSRLENPMDRGAWWTVESVGSQRVRHNWATEHSTSGSS